MAVDVYLLVKLVPGADAAEGGAKDVLELGDLLRWDGDIAGGIGDVGVLIVLNIYSLKELHSLLLSLLGERSEFR